MSAEQESTLPDLLADVKGPAIDHCTACVFQVCSDLRLTQTA